jgi:hypothetical protein
MGGPSCPAARWRCPRHQHGPAAVADKLKVAPPVPSSSSFNCIHEQAIKGGRGRLIRRGQYSQHGGSLTVGVALSLQKTRSPSSHKTWSLRSPSALNQNDGFICGIRRQVGGRHCRRRVLNQYWSATEGGQRSFERERYQSRGGMTLLFPCGWPRSRCRSIKRQEHRKVANLRSGACFGSQEFPVSAPSQGLRDPAGGSYGSPGVSALIRYQGNIYCASRTQQAHLRAVRPDRRSGQAFRLDEDDPPSAAARRLPTQIILITRREVVNEPIGQPPRLATVRRRSRRMPDY